MPEAPGGGQGKRMVTADWHGADIETESLERELQLNRKSLFVSEIVEKTAEKQRLSLHDLHCTPL